MRLLALAVAAWPLLAQSQAWTDATFRGLRLRALGPAFASGRIVSIAVHPSDRAQYYVAAASGGVWKTTNNGTTWSPVFENEGSYSIGVVALDPKNPSTVWVGTGENNSQRSVGYGDGVYRSDDGGRTWRNTGLKKSEHIGRIVIDPRDARVVYVAAQGPLWGPGGDRGLYKTTDGGQSWNKVLDISEHTGITDVALDPHNPDVLLAASYQRRRHVWTLINGGPESGIYKSTDAGASWTKIRTGIPSEDLGRIGLAFSPARAGLVYARIEAANGQGGIFRSLDSGQSWEKRNPFDDLGMYYGQIVADPRDPDRIYLGHTIARVSDDGGRTLRPLGDRAKHVDTHTFWIDPANNNYLLAGCDGGLYETHDGGRFWHFKSNLPITQFYNVDVDNSRPFYFVYGGTQDNFSVGGPSRTRSSAGIVNADWFVTQGGDGFQSRIDPQDPNTVYAEAQYGALVRYDRRTGERLGIQPVEGAGEPPLRWNWESPLVLSPHSRTRLYFAANKVFRSDDRGNSWRAISGDLTRQIDRDSLPVMGRLWGPDAVAKNHSTSFYSNLTALAESPRVEGLVYAGSDDGLMHVLEGDHWRRIGPFPGVPERTYVQRILPSLHDAGSVYACFDNHKNADFKPYLLKSTDRGRSWTSIAGNLPENGPVLSIAEDAVNANLLFVGTEFGLYFTADGGKRWTRLSGGLPTIPVRDLAIQRRENDLVLATFGRGFYILDDYTPLRLVTDQVLSAEATLFPVKNAIQYVESTPFGGRGKAWQGESFFNASNPPAGAVFTYYLKEALQTRKQARQAAEREAAKKNATPPYPKLAELSEEAREEAPVIFLTVTDAAGNVVRRLSGPVTAGFHRVAWDLRGPAPVLPPPRPAQEPDDDPASEPPSGFFVPPGPYQVRLSKRVHGVSTPLGQPRSFEVLAEDNPADRKALTEFTQRLTRLQRATSGAEETALATRQRLTAIQRALRESTAAAAWIDTAAALEKRLDDILIALRGDEALRRRQENTPLSITERTRRIVRERQNSTQAPTRTHEDSYAIASAQLSRQLAALRTLVESDLRKLEQAMEAAGVPPTPGRIPEWRH